MSKVGVFVSYNHKDIIIAEALVQALTSISADLEVFIDHAGLTGGDEYEPKLSRSIQAAHWFIMICSGARRSNKNMNWCFYEAGQFRNKITSEWLVTSLYNLLCYLYDEEKPSQLQKYQGTRISELNRGGNKLDLSSETDSLDYEKTELFDLIDAVVEKSADVPLRDLTDRSVRKLMRNGVRQITQAFTKNIIDEVIDEIVFQPRISFKVSPGNAANATGLTPETAIVGYSLSLATVFGIAGDQTKWSDIKRKSLYTHNVEPLWISDVEIAAQEIAKGGVPTQTDALCIGVDRAFYRPIVARYELYRSGAKNCYVVFIPARSRQFAISQRASLLLSALILSVRFRQRVLPIVDDVVAAEAQPATRKIDLLNRLQKQIIAIETEAIEFGLPVPRDEYEEPPLLDAFREGPTKEEIRREILDWTKTRNIIFDNIAAVKSPDRDVSASDAAKLVVKEFVLMRQINGKFITALAEELLYVEKTKE